MLTDAEIQEIILSIAQKQQQLNPTNIHAYIEEQGLEVDKTLVYDVFHRLVLKGWLRPTDPYIQWHRLTVYGRAALTDEIELSFLDSRRYIARTKEAIPNIDNITINYLRESIEAFTQELMLSATVALGAASERAILELLDSYCNFKNDPSVTQRFEETCSIKGKYELLKEQFKMDNLRRTLPQMLGSKGIVTSDLDRHFVEFETIVDNLFHIYRINRNDAGHPIGVEMDKNSLRCNIAAFKRYAETIFALKYALDNAG
jgi:hypothetical protein